MKKRCAFLFGAGAVLDWGAPKTICKNSGYQAIPEHGSATIKKRPCCLTHLITATGFKAEEGSRISDYIFKLLNSRHQNSNFETLISLVEELYSYWSFKHADSKKYGGLHSLFDIDNLLKEFQYYHISDLNQKTGSYTLSIPGFGDTHIERNIPSTIHPSQKYFEMFLNDLLESIQGSIYKYSYYTESKKNVLYNETNNALNSSFCSWMSSFVSNGFALRMYSLNYDRLFKILLDNTGISIFDGFDSGNTTLKYDRELPPNMHKIVTDFDDNSFYNLHGCVDWRIGEYNLNGIDAYQYYLVPPGVIERFATSLEIEKGRNLLLTSIITGYQKVQRTSISPYRQMFSSFDFDCHKAERLYIVGYSFGDEHINDIVRNARKYNTNLEITLIDPSADIEKFNLDFLSHWDFPEWPNFVETNKNEFTASKFKVNILKKEFKEFLMQYSSTSL